MSSPPSPRKIYTDLLLSKVLGYPLYYPEPYTNALRRGWSGVSIGDVGIINSDGGFDFQFNVVKKPNVLPDPNSDVLASVANGMPLHPELSFHDRLPQFHPIILQESEIRYNNNDCYPGKVIGRHITHTISMDGQILMHTPPSPITAGLTFNIECSHEKAASLILPNGATRMDVVDEQLGQFYNLARRHGASWLGLFPFSSPSLCLVTGCVKTSGWALMSLYGSSRTGGLSLKFGVGAGPSWTWLEAGPADTRHSPKTDDPNRNHCVFLRGIRISKRKRKWPFRRKGVDVDVLDTGERHPFNTEGGRSTSGSTTRTHLAPTSIGSSTSNSGSQRDAGQATSREDEDNTSMDSDQSDEDIVIEPLTEVSISNHPSEIINQRLLHENPSAEFAITHDDQWANVLREFDTPLDEEGLWLRMLEKHNVIVESNCVFFEDKGTPGSGHGSQGPITQFGILPNSDINVFSEAIVPTSAFMATNNTPRQDNVPIPMSNSNTGETEKRHKSRRDVFLGNITGFINEAHNQGEVVGYGETVYLANAEDHEPPQVTSTRRKPQDKKEDFKELSDNDAESLDDEGGGGAVFHGTISGPGNAIALRKAIHVGSSRGNSLIDSPGASRDVQQRLRPQEENEIVESRNIIQGLKQEPMITANNFPRTKKRQHGQNRADPPPQQDFDMNSLTKEFQGLTPEMQRFVNLARQGLRSTDDDKSMLIDSLIDSPGASRDIQQRLRPQEKNEIVESRNIIQSLEQEPMKITSRYMIYPTVSLSEPHRIEHAQNRADPPPQQDFDMNSLTKEFQGLTPEMQRFINVARQGLRSTDDDDDDDER